MSFAGGFGLAAGLGNTLNKLNRTINQAAGEFELQLNEGLANVAQNIESAITGSTSGAVPPTTQQRKNSSASSNSSSPFEVISPAGSPPSRRPPKAAAATDAAAQQTQQHQAGEASTGGSAAADRRENSASSSSMGASASAAGRSTSSSNNQSDRSRAGGGGGGGGQSERGLSSNNQSDRSRADGGGGGGQSERGLGRMQEETVYKADNMICDNCSVKFTFLKRRKECVECKVNFCTNCMPPTPSRGGSSIRMCGRCRVLLASPSVRGDLMELRVKDLQRFLIRKKVSTKNCVEKKDLVELVIGSSPVVSSGGSGGGGGGAAAASSAGGDAATAVPDKVDLDQRQPVERQKSFPKSYVTSTHRDEWFSKLDANNQDHSDPSVTPDVFETPVEPMEAAASDAFTDEQVVEATPVQEMDQVFSDDDDTAAAATTTQPANQDGSLGQSAATGGQSAAAVGGQSAEATGGQSAEATGGQSVTGGQSATGATAATPEAVASAPDDEHLQSSCDTSGRPSGEPPTAAPIAGGASADQGASGGGSDQSEVERLRQAALARLTEAAAAARLQPDLGHVQQKSEVSPLSSPRRFANQGLVYLSEIETLEDLHQLSARQAKEILAMNRVNFKGVIEKDELLKIIERLWRQEKKTKEDADELVDSDLCKICMDSPVDCVMLECGHMCTCVGCGKQMAECPICRQYVVRVVRTFKA